MMNTKDLLKNAESALPESIFKDVDIKHINEEGLASLKMFTATFTMKSKQYWSALHFNEILYQRDFNLKLQDVFESVDKTLNRSKQYCFYLIESEFLVSVYQHNFNKLSAEFRGIVFKVVNFQEIDHMGKMTGNNVYEFRFEYYEHP